MARFDSCSTAELARRAIANLVGVQTIRSRCRRQIHGEPINDCDRLVASISIRRSRLGPRHVAFDKVDAEQAITACNKAIDQNPRVASSSSTSAGLISDWAASPVRTTPKPPRPSARPRLNYDDAAKRGYVGALNNLAVAEPERHRQRDQ